MNSQLIKAFKIYKKGTTVNWITVLCLPHEIEAKKQKYIYLGYKIKEVIC